MTNREIVEEIELVEEAHAAKEGVWCLIANVAPEAWHGTPEEGGLERGTKHFSPNTKVYCYYGTRRHGSDSIQVLGRHRGGARLVTMIVAHKFLTNWRAKVVYDPYIIKKLGKGWEKEVAESWAKWLNFDEKVRHTKKVGFDTVDPNTALLYAAYLGSVPHITAALERGADVHIRGEEERTPLLLAAYTYRTDALQLLLDHGADINAQDKEGWTPLLIAVANRNERVVRLLVMYGADQTIYADDGTTIASILEKPYSWAKQEIAHALAYPRIVISGGVYQGVPFIRNSRVPTPTVVHLIKRGRSAQEILADFPELEMDDIREAVQYANNHLYAPTRPPSRGLSRPYRL